MLSYFSWAKKKCLDFYLATNKTISQTVTFGSYLYNSPSVQNTLTDLIQQSYQGFRRPFVPVEVPVGQMPPVEFKERLNALIPAHIQALRYSPKTWQVYQASLKTNLGMVLGPAFFYGAVKWIWQLIDEDSAQRVAFTPESLAVLYFFLQFYPLLFVRNNIFNIIFAKVAYEENLNLLYDTPCDCGTIPIIKANIASNAYYASNLFAYKMISSSLPFGKWIEPFFYAYVMGLVFIEYLLGNLCTTHRYDVMTKNNAFAFGLGLAYVLLVELTCLLITILTGVDNTYTRMAISALWYQQFILITYLIDKPLPGKKPGIDIFFYGRMVMESILQKSAAWIIEGFQQPNVTVDWKKVVDKMRHFPPFEFLLNFLIPKNYCTWNDFVRTPEMQIFFDRQGNGIQRTLEWMIDVRNKPLNQRAGHAAQYLPDFIVSKEIKNLLKIILEKKLDGVLEGINQVITEARLKIKIHDRETLTLLTLSEALAIAREGNRPESLTEKTDVGDFVMSHSDSPKAKLLSESKEKDNKKVLVIYDYHGVQQSSELQRNSIFKQEQQLFNRPAATVKQRFSKASTIM